ncbi:hypothetical protein AGMMS49921_07070 [Endomicrobiia bacterium]|nr:hypothetical protein AGMMS49921_07070 [Endomicrobiia bacterium]
MYPGARFLHHAGQLGYVDKDLWNKYTNQELRDILTDRLVGAKNTATALVSTYGGLLYIGEDRFGIQESLETCRQERKSLDVMEIAILLHTLGVPSKHVIGCLQLNTKNWGIYLSENL